jgi:hypothetical protein
LDPKNSLKIPRLVLGYGINNGRPLEIAVCCVDHVHLVAVVASLISSDQHQSSPQLRVFRRSIVACWWEVKRVKLARLSTQRLSHSALNAVCLARIHTLCFAFFIWKCLVCSENLARGCNQLLQHQSLVESVKFLIRLGSIFEPSKRRSLCNWVCQWLTAQILNEYTHDVNATNDWLMVRWRISFYARRGETLLVVCGRTRVGRMLITFCARDTLRSAADGLEKSTQWVEITWVAILINSIVHWIHAIEKNVDK